MVSINFVDVDFMDKNNIIWIKNTIAKSIDTKNKVVNLEDESIKYDKLLIATGAKSFIPPIKNIKEGNNIYSLRDIEDVFYIKEKIKKSKKVAIIGAGLIGIDVLTSLLEINNLEVSLIYPNDYILDLQLDEYSAKIYERKFIERGAKLYSSLPVNQIILDDNKNVKGVELGDNSIVKCDLLIVATGVRPNTEILRNTDIEENRGIVINNKCETSAKEITGYTLKEEPTNKNGNYIEGNIDVIYYYTKNDGNITENELVKEGTEFVSNINDTLSYALKYTGIEEE